jgi:hypothetical protein
VAVVAAGTPDLGRVVELWPGILDQMRQSGAGMLSAVVGAARPVAVDPESGTLTIAFPPDSGFHLRKADDKESRALVADAIGTVLGAPLRPVFTMHEEGEPGHEPDQGSVAVGEDDLFERFVVEFDAEVVIDEPEQADERIEETS